MSRWSLRSYRRNEFAATRRISGPRRVERPDRRFSITEILAVLGAIGVAVGAFCWASGAVRSEAYYRFFGVSSSLFPAKHEELVFTGAFDQINLWMVVCGVVAIGWIIACELNDPRYPKLLAIYKACFSGLKSISISIIAIGFLGAVVLIGGADERGKARAREVARKFEAGALRTTTVLQTPNSKGDPISGLGLVCSDKFCAIYQRGMAATEAGADAAAGRTFIVPIEAGMCISTAPLPPEDRCGVRNLKSSN